MVWRSSPYCSFAINSRTASKPFCSTCTCFNLAFACMSQAWNILGGYCGQVSFGHSVFWDRRLWSWHGSGNLRSYAMAWRNNRCITRSDCVAHYKLSLFQAQRALFCHCYLAIVEIFNRLFMVWYWVVGLLV